MAFREVLVTEVKEVLRAWLAGLGKRPAAARAGVNVKTAARYIRAAQEAGLSRDSGEGRLTDELIGVVSRLEQGTSTLEESLALWERGEALARRCEEWLIGAKARLDAARAGVDRATDAGGARGDVA